MTQAQFDINEVIDKMLTEHENMAAMAPAQQAAFRYLVLRKNAVLLPPGHELAHREREMVPADVYDDLAKDLERTRAALNQTSDTAEAMCLQRDAAQKQCRELAQRVIDLEKNAARYVWLRDKSESVHPFYLSTPIWFTGVKFNQKSVDCTIDAAMTKPAEITDVSQLGADAKCPICYDVGHIIVDDTKAEYVTAPCPECNIPFNDMATAPRDGTMLLLKVRFTENSTEDDEVAVTIGANNLDHDEIDEWKFAGWCWTHDHFTDGKGTPLGWLPLVRRS